MATSQAAVSSFRPAAYKVTVTDVTLDTSYVTGGYVLTAANLGLTSVKAATADITTPSSAATNAVVATPLVQTDGSVNLKVLNAAATPVEIAGAASLAAMVVRVTAFGH